MATYVVGDVQGCFEPLMQLIKVIAFKPSEDNIIFCGDLVNRGGRSLDVLRWVYAHQNCCDAVLGNHDLSMLSKYYLGAKKISNPEFKAIFMAPDARLLFNWLLHRPLYIELKKHIIVHAGIFPGWQTEQFKNLADSTVEKLLASPKSFFQTMYGNNPRKWSADLNTTDTCRFVINACTRMRFVSLQESRR